MNKYSELSDFEINKRVCRATKIVTRDVPDFCSSWADGGPIMLDNNISMFSTLENVWSASTWVENKRICVEFVRKAEVLRAAMEVFLMMEN